MIESQTGSLGRLLIGVLLLCQGPFAHAVWVVEPSVEVSTAYDDNVRLAAEEADEEDAVVSAATAQARLRNVTETSELSGVAGFSYVVYSGVDDLDDEDAQFLSLNARTDTERARFAFAGSVRRDLILREIAPIPDLLPDAGGAADEGGEVVGEEIDDVLDNEDIDLNSVNEQVRRTRMRFTPNAEYRLTELSRVRAGVQYSQRSFDSDGEAAGLRDSEALGGTLGIRTDLSPRDTVGFTVGAARIETDTAPGDTAEADNYTAAATWEHQWSPVFRVGVDLGASRTENEQDEDTHLAFALRATRRTPLSRFDVRAERSTVPSAFGGVVQAGRLTFRYQRALSPYLELDLSAYGYHTERLGDPLTVDDEDRSYAEVQPRLIWRFSRDWNVGLGYRYRWADRPEDESSVDGNNVSVSLAFQPPGRL